MTGRRAVAATLLALLAAAPFASADPLVPSLHESSRSLAVPPTVRAVVVDVDAGSVTVTPGAPHGTAHLRWDLQEPTVTSTVKDGVMRVVGRCADNQVVVAGAVYVGVPTEPCSVDVTLVVPASVSVDLTGDAISVSGTRGAAKVRAYDSVRLTRLGPGAVDAQAYDGGASLTSSHPARVVLRAASGVTLSDVTAGDVSATSDNGAASLEHVTARDVSVVGGGTMTLSRISARSLSVRSYTGSAALRDVTVARSLKGVANGTVTLTGAKARALSLSSDTSGVQLTTADVRGLATLTGDGTVSAAQLHAAAASLTSYTADATLQSSRVLGRVTAEANRALVVDTVQAGSAVLKGDTGGLDVRSSVIPLMTGTANNNVSVVLARVPSHVTLRSDTAALSLDVPSARYAVLARSGTGRVVIRGIVVDPQAPRSLDLEANGNVTVD